MLCISLVVYIHGIYNNCNYVLLLPLIVCISYFANRKLDGLPLQCDSNQLLLLWKGSSRIWTIWTFSSKAYKQTNTKHYIIKDGFTPTNPKFHSHSCYCICNTNHATNSIYVVLNQYLFQTLEGEIQAGTDGKS